MTGGPLSADAAPRSAGAEPLAGTCPILSHTRQWNAPSLRKLKRTALRRRDARGAFDQGEALAMCDRIGVMNEDP
jgi:hypothetical protein